MYFTINDFSAHHIVDPQFLAIGPFDHNMAIEGIYLDVGRENVADTLGAIGHPFKEGDDGGIRGNKNATGIARSIVTPA